MSAVALYYRYVMMTVTSQMAYKTSFCFMTTGHFFVTLIEFVGVWALFQRFDTIAGWTLHEVAVFYGFIHVAFALAEGIGRGFDVFHLHVKHGTFDRILLRPRSLVLQILGSEFQLMRVGRLLQGILVFAWGLNRLEHEWNWVFPFVIGFALGGAIALFIGLMVFQATLSFWSVESLEIVNVFTYGGVHTAQYPMDIYQRWFQKCFVYLIPIGSVSYFPISTILRQGNLLLGFAGPLMGYLFLLVSLLAFRSGVRYYRSTGS